MSFLGGVQFAFPTTALPVTVTNTSIGVTGTVNTQAVPAQVQYNKVFPITGASQDLFASKQADNVNPVISAAEQTAILASCKYVEFQLIGTPLDILNIRADGNAATTADGVSTNLTGGKLDSVIMATKFRFLCSNTAAKLVVVFFM